MNVWVLKRFFRKHIAPWLALVLVAFLYLGAESVSSESMLTFEQAKELVNAETNLLVEPGARVADHCLSDNTHEGVRDLHRGHIALNKGCSRTSND